MIPAEWTDFQWNGRPQERSKPSLALVEDLLRSRTIVDALQSRFAAKDRETASLNVESVCANQTELHGRPSRPKDIGVGPTQRRAEKRRR